jgi:hypothetical protein
MKVLLDTNIVLDVLLRRGECVTRDPEDFTSAPVRVLSPTELAASLRHEG